MLLMAQAADCTIVEVEELVPVGSIDPDHIHTPGIFVKRIICGAPYEKKVEQKAGQRADQKTDEAIDKGMDSAENEREQVEGRAFVIRRLKPLPILCLRRAIDVYPGLPREEHVGVLAKFNGRVVLTLGIRSRRNTTRLRSKDVANQANHRIAIPDRVPQRARLARRSGG